MGPIEEEITELVGGLVEAVGGYQASPTSWFVDLPQYNQDLLIMTSLSAIVDAVTRLAREVDQLRE